MTAIRCDSPPAATWPQRLPLYYGWVSVAIAACAMTATLPGRTHGLGLITERLLADLSIAHTTYAQINLVCTLLGAAFCLPVGYLIDKRGVRIVLTLNLLLLGASVLAMSQATGPVSLFVTLLLIRGFGQGALSVVSMAIIGKWFRRRLGPAMGFFAVLLTIGFIGSILGMGAAIERFGWREAWNWLGYSLLAFAPIAWLLTRNTPEACGIEPDEDIVENAANSASRLFDFDLRAALRTPAFWIVSAGTASFNLVWSAITLFNESILAERGFDASVAVQIMAILTGCGLVANLAAGKLATRERIGKLLGVGLIILTSALALFPQVASLAHVQMYAVAMGVTGGIVTVVFFAAWGHLFGRAHLGRIQGVAQLISILASATGPLLLAESREATGSYSMMFYLLAVAVAVAALTAFGCKAPQNSTRSETEIEMQLAGHRLEPVQE